MPGNVVEVTEASFHTEVLGAKLPVLVDFWAPWCAPCKTIAPVIEGLASEFAGKIKFCKINTDENPSTGMNYRVSSVPTFLMFQAGKVVGQVVGARSNELRSVVERVVSG